MERLIRALNPYMGYVLFGIVLTVLLREDLVSNGWFPLGCSVFLFTYMMLDNHYARARMLSKHTRR